MTPTATPPATRFGWCHFDSWAGKFKIRVEILRETPKRYQVKFLGSAGKRIPAGSTALAPKHAVKIGGDAETATTNFVALS